MFRRLINNNKLRICLARTDNQSEKFENLHNLKRKKFDAKKIEEESHAEKMEKGALEEIKLFAYPKELINQLNSDLSSKKFNDALKILNGEENREKILKNYQNVIQDVIWVHLTNNNYEAKPKLYEASECILMALAEQCYQDKAFIFELMEKIEEQSALVDDNADHIFTSVLKALQVLLIKHNAKHNALYTALMGIEDYLQRIKLPALLEKKCLEDEEEKLLENDDKIRRILMIYITLDLFYQPLVKQMLTSDDKIRRNILFCFVLRLLGKPFAFMDLSVKDNKEKTYTREVAESFVATLCAMMPNFYQMLEIVEDRVRWPKKKVSENVKAIFYHPEKTPLVPLGILFYLVIAEEIGIDKIPKVYSPMYLLKGGVYLVDGMLQNENESIKCKGLKLFSKLLEGVDEQFESDILDIEIYRSVCDNLVKLLIFSPSKRNRQDALKILRMYLLKFKISSRYLLIKHIMNTSNHKGLIGYLATFYKDIIFESLNSPSNYIKGTNFKNILFNHICKLDKGVETDISESSDQIIAALNFLFGILLRDKENVTGIKDALPTLENGYLAGLRKALDMSRAHFKAEIDRVKVGKQEENNEDHSIEILNDNTPLEKFTNEKKVEMLHSALSLFDLIDFHLARVNDLIAKE